MSPTECVGGINGKVVSSVDICKRIGCHRPAVARVAAMVAADTNGSGRETETGRGTEAERQETGTRERAGK